MGLALTVFARRDMTRDGCKKSNVLVLGRELRSSSDGSLSIGPSIELAARVPHRVPTVPLPVCIKTQSELEALVDSGKRVLSSQYPSWKDCAANIRLHAPSQSALHGAQSGVYILEMPHLPKSIQVACFPRYFQTSSTYNSVTREVNRALSMPFSLVEFDETHLITRLADPQAPLPLLKSAPSLTIDEETHNWQAVQVRREMESLPLEEVRARYDQACAAFGESAHERERVFWGKAQYARELEVMINRNRDERITVMSMIGDADSSGLLLTTLDAGVDTISFRIPPHDKEFRFRIRLVDDMAELIAQANEVFSETDPFYLLGYNHLKFDLKKPDELSKKRGVFLPGVGGRPVIHLSGGAGNFIEQTTAPGRVEIDPCTNHQFRGRTPNNKMDTVKEDVLGIKLKKRIGTHAELAVMTARAEAGSRQDAHDILLYAAEDAAYTRDLSMALLEENLMLARFYRSRPGRINTVSIRTLVEDAWAQWFFGRYGCHPEFDFGKLSFGLRDDYSDSARLRYWNDFDGSSELSSRLDLQSKKVLGRPFFQAGKGVHQAYLVAVVPLPSLFARELAPANQGFDELYRYVRDCGDKKKKVRLYNDLSGYSEFLLYQLFANAPGNASGPVQEKDISMVRERAYARWFYAPQSKPCAQQDGIGAQAARGSLLAAHANRWNALTDRLCAVFGEFEVINRNGYQWLVREPSMAQGRERLEALLRRMEESGYAVVQGHGSALSLGLGRFATYMDGQLLTPGMMDFGSKKGDRNPFTQQFCLGLIECVLVQGDMPAAVSFVDGMCRSFYAGEAPTVHTRTLARSFHEFSSEARAGYVEKAAQLRAHRGDEITYRYDDAAMAMRYFGIGKGGELRKKDSLLGSMVFACMNPHGDREMDGLIAALLAGKGSAGLCARIADGAVRGARPYAATDGANAGFLF